MCGKVEPKRIVELYKQNGYSGIVLTDHYSELTFYNRHLFHPQKEEERDLRPISAVSRGGASDPLPCGRPVPSGRMAYIREHGPLNG